MIAMIFELPLFFKPCYVFSY